tara:strand:- start:427 stop:750 length:324 start_codon:yes stop_codon:yes gene_type:complete
MPRGSWQEFGESSPNESKNKLDSFQSKFDLPVRVKKTRGGKAGKTVTIVSGLVMSLSESKKLLKKLKVKCGTGGTLKEDTLELQGDKVIEVIEHLIKEGYKPKQSGS